MLKRSLIFAGLILLILFICIQTNRLFLTFYVFFPFLTFPLFYFYHEDNPYLFSVSALISAVVFGGYLFLYPSVEMVIFGLGYCLFCFILSHYSLAWMRVLRFETVRRDHSLKELNNLREKHRVRLDSLERLEKQVVSLMELFEIARDFSAALNFDVLTKIIYEKVLPELPFGRIRLLLSKPHSQRLEFLKTYTISKQGVKTDEPRFSDEEMQALLGVYSQKRVIRKDIDKTSDSCGEIWYFPLLVDDQPAAVVVVEEANPDDFVKFEVLAAQLVLQVQKINLYETTLELSIIDGLTGVYVRRYFLERIAEELKRSIKYRLPMAVLMLDIDHFKRYNDDFGHLIGDETLKNVASLIRQNLRKVDIVARYGGEEFIAVLPESKAEDAFEIAERIRSGIARHKFKVYDEDAAVTISIGIASFPEDIEESKRLQFSDDSVYDLIRRADKALYRAKEEGRNRIFRYSDML